MHIFFKVHIINVWCFLAGREELEPGSIFRGAGLWDYFK